MLAALGNAVVHMFVLPTYPAWSLIAIALDVVVIYALTVHGAALDATRRRPDGAALDAPASDAAVQSTCDPLAARWDARPWT